MTTKQQLEDLKKRIEYLEKQNIKLESRLIMNKSRENSLVGDAEFLGGANKEISLNQIKSAIQVLENYKAQGFKTIQL